MALVVIDAGHGGSNPGAVYNGRQEKDDALEGQTREPRTGGGRKRTMPWRWLLRWEIFLRETG